jgi:hypothetical protein
MRRIITALACISLLSGCFILHKKASYGCPTNGRNIGAEKLAAGDEKAMKASEKARYKGGRKAIEP